MTVRNALSYVSMVLGTAALVGLAACAEKPTEHPFPKTKPEVTITGIQISGGVTRVFANGTDEDGQVLFYRFNFDDGAIVADSLTTPVYDANITYGSMDEVHTVSVVAVA